MDRVSQFENQQADGLALCSDDVLERKLSQVQDLRERDAAYWDALPSEPMDAIRAARSVLQPDGEEAPHSLEEALHLSRLLTLAVARWDQEGTHASMESLHWVTGRIADALQETRTDLREAADMLKKPIRSAMSDKI